MAEAEQRRMGLLSRLISPLVGRDNLEAQRTRREQENRMLRESIAAQGEFVDLLGRTVEVPRGVAPSPGPQLWQDPNTGQLLPSSPVAGPGGFDTVPEFQTPQGQQRMLQSLARMSPEGAMKVGEALLPGSTKRATAAMKEMQMFGYPMTQDGFRQYQEDRGGGEDPITSMLLAMQLRSEEQEALRRKREADREAEELETEHTSFRNNLQVSGDTLMELALVNERLMGREGVANVLARPGLGFDELRRMAANLYDEDITTDIDTFNSLTNQIAISRLDTEGFDGNTNKRFEAFTSTKPSFKSVGPANYVTIRNNMRGVLLADDAAPTGAKLPEYTRKKYEREVDRLTRLIGDDGGADPVISRTVTLPDGKVVTVDNVPPGISDEQIINMIMQGRR